MLSQFLWFNKYTKIEGTVICQIRLMPNDHVTKGARILSLDKLSSKEICSILISNIVNKPTSNSYFEKLCKNTILD